MKDELGDVAGEEVDGLKPKFYLIVVSDSSEYKKAKGANKKAVAKKSHNEYKDVLLNKKYLRHSINRTQSSNHTLWTCGIFRTSLYCFDGKVLSSW